MKKNLWVVSVLLTVVLVIGVFMISAAAAQGNGRGNGRGSDRENRRGQTSVQVQKIYPLDAEIKVIDGQPMIVTETKAGYVYFPFMLSGNVLLDGRQTTLAIQGNAVMIPTEDGLVAVPIEDFDVAMANGQLILITEENPIIIKIPLIKL